MNDTYTMLQKRKNELTQYKEIIIKRLECLKYKGKPRYHVRFDLKRNKSYLSDTSKCSKKKKTDCDPAFVSQVASFDYLNRTLKLIESEIKLIDRFISYSDQPSPESYYETLSRPRQKMITPIRQTDKQYIEQWISEPSECKGFSEEDESEYYTNKNERVRSKSEIIIANELARLNIPYKYECPLYLEGLGVIHPDFTMLNVKKRKILYWEHLGRMDDEDYSKKNIKRINIYQKNGVYIGERLILTMETSVTPLDVRLVDSLITRFLLE